MQGALLRGTTVEGRPRRGPASTGFRLLRAPALEALTSVNHVGLRSRTLFQAMARHPSGIPQKMSADAALRAADHAFDQVPAYRDYLLSVAWAAGNGKASERLAALPETDKKTYIDAYSIAERCVGGRVPANDVEVDESSGSSGKPYSWVRSRAELEELHRSLSKLAHHLFGKDLVILNGFSMGAWATGANVAAALANNGIIKSPGPDTEKILSAFDLLGPGQTYVVAGYPPFLRQLLEAGEREGVDWARYRMYGVVGGEAMSEALRTRLEKQFIAVYSAYGASDLDIGVAGEFPLSIRIRQEAASNPALAEALFGEGSRLPMLFQYNPLDYYVETNAAGELVVTVNRLSMLSPRIRYNVHDAGGALSFERAIAICRDFGLDPIAEAEARTGIPAFRLPFLFIRGRSDSTLSYMGANIYPEDVEAGLFSDAGDGDRLGAFCLELVEREGGAGRPCVHVEVAKGSPEDPDLAVRLAGRVRDHLIAASRDFRSASAEDSEHGQILIRLHGHNEGPFAENSHRIKRRYIVQ